MRSNSIFRRSTISPTNMRFEGTLCQHRSTMHHTRFEIWWLGRGGLAPFSIEYVAAISVISKNGSRPVRTFLE